MKKVSRGFAACLIAASAGLAQAGGYIGAAVGQTDVDVDISEFDDGDSISISGGYKFNKHIAIEASYIDLGEAEDNIDPVWTLEADGFNFAVVGILPIGNVVELFAKAGVFMWDVSISEAGYGEFYSEDGNDLSYGIGAAFNITPQFGLVAEYQRFDVDDEDLSNISIGARFNF